MDLWDDARAASRQARSLRRVGHRPFPLPASRWTLGQTWEHTFWAHWPVPLADVRLRVPDDLEIEEYDGSAWLGIQFFRVRALRARGALPVPGISSFLQLNLRTYVRGPDGLPGVWFFSIDASSRLAAIGVRRIYRVPAFYARMTLEPIADWQEAECVRVGEPGRVFAARYRPTGETFHTEAGSLESFLTERYRIFTADARAEMHHDRWLLSPAEAEVELASISPLVLDGAPRCHFAFRQDALIWPPEPISA
ncbi:MAG TPA: DUF2071 domain-containing protein [Gaiellaceae bacterium]|nr:DUF2071 domain-containing protein [Gaiellaceae bacterium]